jgi:type II restriction enzyme
VSLLTQIGWRSHIQSVVTENDLICWYEKALSGKYASMMGNKLLETLCEEIAQEFPSVDKQPPIIRNRHYESITDPFWV